MISRDYTQWVVLSRVVHGLMEMIVELLRSLSRLICPIYGSCLCHVSCLCLSQGTPVYWYWPLPTFRGSRPRLDSPPSFLSGCQSLQDIWQWCMSFEFLFITQEGPNRPVPPHSVQNTDNKWMMGQQRLIPIPIIQEGSNRGLIMTDPRYEVQFKFLVFLLSTAQFNHELSLSVLQ